MNMIKNLLKKYNIIHLWYAVLWRDKPHFDLPRHTRIKYAIRGFKVDEVIWFDLEHNNWHNYVSDFERMQSREINGIYKVLLDDKILFEEFFGRYAHVPINYAWVNDGHIYSLHDYDISNRNILQFIRLMKKIVFKYCDRGGGKGTYILECMNEDILVNGIKMPEDEIEILFRRKGKSIFCEYIVQAEFSASLFPYTTNTIRIVCAKKKGEEKAKTIAAVQRIGRMSSIPVDNFSSGGFVCEINLATGELSDAIAGLGDEKTRMTFFTHHPDTGEKIAGKIIPNWTRLKMSIEDLTNKMPYFNFIAWDVLLISDEDFVVIEGNASSGVELFQMHQGIVGTDLGEIYKEYGIGRWAKRKSKAKSS